MKYLLQCFLVILLFSCEHINTDIYLKDFYYDITNLKTPQIYQYINSDGTNESFTYNKISKINDKILLLEQYNDSYKLVNRTLMEYSNIGIKYKEVWLEDQGDNGGLFKQTIIDSLVFPFNLKYNPVKFKSEGEPNDDIKVVFELENQLTEPKDTIINGLMTQIVYGRGNKILKIKSSKIPLLAKKRKYKDLVVYQKGVGIILLKSVDENNNFNIMKLVRILSIDEFENLRNSI
jgi:hypothetical protein